MRRRAIVSLCVLLLGLAPAASASAASPASVGASLERIGLPADERAAAVATFARARAVARAVGGARGRAIRAVATSTAALVADDGATPALARIAFLELAANVDRLEAHRLPPPGTRIRIDGVVYESYAGQGLRIQPLGTYFAILEPGRGVAADGGVADAMTAAQTIVLETGDEARLPYLFPYAGMRPPWYSAMAEAVAASAGASAWRRTQRAEFLAMAIRFGNAALARALPTDAGGLWFPLYAAQPGYRVLNGHLEATIAMGALARATGDDAFATAFASAVATARAALPLYDTGGWGRYAPGEDAPVRYMTLMASQLRRLGALTGDPAFTRQGAAFARDLERLPRVRGPREPVVARRRGARRPVAVIVVRRDKPVTLTLVVTTPRGRPTPAPSTTVSLPSGSSAIEVAVPKAAGRYVVRAVAEDWAGNRAGPIRLAAVRVRR